MRRDMGEWLLIAFLGILIFSIGAVSAIAQQKADPFKIGIVTSISGPGYGYGQRAVLGIRYRIEEEINKAGGINGHPVQLITYDTAMRPDQTAMLVERAATVDKVFAVLGPNASSDVAAGFPTSARLNVPTIALGGTLRGICEKNAPWCFSSMMSDDFSMEPLALLVSQYKAKNMVVMTDSKYNYAVSQGEWGYKIAQQKGIKVAHDKGKLDVETGWPDFTPQVSQMKGMRPDIICAVLYPRDLAHLAIAMKGAGIDVKQVPCFGSLMVLPEMIVAGGEATEGWYGSSDFDIESPDPVQKVWQKKLTDYGKSITSDAGIYTVSTNTACGYDAAAFICEAMRSAKITPSTPLQEARAKIRDELPKVRAKTYTSAEFRFGEGGRYEKNRLVKPIYLLQIKGQKLVSVGQVTE
jgi:ABC-type branched-subunit amino acid transport system substrate-binding protein